VTKCIVHDLFDRARASATLGAAAEAAVNLAAAAWRILFDGTAHVMIGNHIARADNHRRPSVLTGY
jgi:hypothetical protein